MYTFNENIVSDLHKDARGFRPTEYFWEEWTQCGDDARQVIWDNLCSELEETMDREQLTQAQNYAKLLNRILEVMHLGAEDTKSALQCIMEAEEFSDYDIQYGADYFCYHFGLSYDTKKKLPIQEAMNEMLAEVA